jgi:hypothetical protein
MPTLMEFTLTLRLRHEEATGITWTVFRFATTRQFTSFRYEIDLDDRLDEPTRAIDFRLRGVNAPTNLMPGSGAAEKEICYPDLDGTWTVTVAGAKQSGRFSFAVDAAGIRLLSSDTDHFLPITVDSTVETVRA